MEKPKKHWKRKVAIGIVVVAIALVAWVYYEGNHAVQATYTAQELGNSIVGQVSPLFDNIGVEIWGVVEAPADHVWKVVTDQDRFAEFMPYVEKSKVVERAATYLVEEQTLNLPLRRYQHLKLKIWYETGGSKRSAQWTQIEGVPKVNRGAWVVEAAGDKTTLLRYQVVCDPGHGVPGWLLRFYMKHKLKAIVMAVKNRVKDVTSRDPKYFEEAKK